MFMYLLVRMYVCVHMWRACVCMYICGCLIGQLGISRLKR